jgi:hypothetical protein
MKGTKLLKGRDAIGPQDFSSDISNTVGYHRRDIAIVDRHHHRHDKVTAVM